jgi:hypothetical protein
MPPVSLLFIFFFLLFCQTVVSVIGDKLSSDPCRSCLFCCCSIRRAQQKKKSKASFPKTLASRSSTFELYSSSTDPIHSCAISKFQIPIGGYSGKSIDSGGFRDFPASLCCSPCTIMASPANFRPVYIV